jgi:hypothetical protein
VAVLPAVALGVSVVAVLISGITAWRTLSQRGNLQMTQPAIVAFLHNPPGEGSNVKVVLRALVYSTGKRGHIVEAIYLNVRRGGVAQVFNFWGYGNQAGALVAGGGLRIGEDGVVYNHHFLPPRNQRDFQFAAGEYQLEVYATVANRSSPTRLYRLHLSLNEEWSRTMQGRSAGVVFSWQPDTQDYQVSESPSLVGWF